MDNFLLIQYKLCGAMLCVVCLFRPFESGLSL